MFRPKYDHAESFMLMKYATRKDGPGPDPLVERIWNSRDGVTPFIVRAPDGREMTHADWGKDQYEPFWPHTGLKVGDRIFVDMTREAAEGHMEKRRAGWLAEYHAYLGARWAKLLADRSFETEEKRVAFLVAIETQWGLGGNGLTLTEGIDQSVPYPDMIPPVEEWDEIIESMVEAALEPGSPNIVTVDQAMLDQLRRNFPKPVNQMMGRRFA